MMAIMSDTDRIAKALVPTVREMLLEEVRKLAAADRKAQIDETEAEIDEACREVARAADRLTAARFSGAPEGAAHRNLVKAAMALGKTMRKHGRMPKGEA